MGQGIRTAIAMIIADEMDINWDRVRIEQAPADRKYGNQVTGGSQSIDHNYDTLRNAGAAARQMLVNAAADEWNLDPALCQTESGQVIHPDGTQILPYEDLVVPASLLDIPDKVEVKEGSRLRIVGTDIGHWDSGAILTGQAVYGMDVRLPDTVFAVIARCPVFGGTLENYDDSAAKSIPGVTQIVEFENKIAVVAENSWAAIRGRDALQIYWDEGRDGSVNSEELIQSLINRLPKLGAAGENTLESIYIMPYEAHATMEPMNCTADVRKDSCEIWAPTQNPQEVQIRVGIAIGFKTDKVKVNVPLIGGGFGRRLEADYAVEAALLSDMINAPVQVLWTREDDIQHDYYRNLNVQYFSTSLDEIELPRGRSAYANSKVTTGAWRSVDNFSDAYGTQSFIDEMAAALDRDPLDLRLELYHGRAANVIKVAAEKADWGRDLPAGYGQGIAYHATFGVTHVAQVAEISVDQSGSITVHKVVCAIDCGRVINPDNVAAQMEGGIVFGLTAAIKSQATLEMGRIKESNFHDFPLLNMSEMPLIETHIIESDLRPTGVGEMGVPPIAPAIANAVFAATGKRIRHIPIKPEDLIS
jgi:isoquinoline 1-oxidoreductase beta subunit